MGQMNNHLRHQSSGKMLQQQTGQDDYLAALLKGSPQSKSAWKLLAKESVHSPAYRGTRNTISIGVSRDVRELDQTSGNPHTAEALRQSQEELRQLSLQLLTIQERERRRISADLHDGIGQSLSLIKLSLESVIQQMANAGLRTDGGRLATAESLRLIAQKIKETMSDLHRTTMDLRPSILDDLGIIPTLSWHFREFEMVWHGKKIERNISIKESDVPDPLKTAIFRILQEATHNIAKHAQASIIRVSLNISDGILLLLIEDDGKGFDPVVLSSHRDSARGFGLVTMRERARASNATFALSSAPGKGTRISVSWRLPEDSVFQGAGHQDNPD